MPKLCPICRKAASAPTRPFCSGRCADIDLGRWLTEHYVVPGADGEAELTPRGDEADMPN